MTAMSNTTQKLELKVIRQPPELVPPVAPTPYEFKELSNLDDQEGLRIQIRVIMLYSGKSNPNGLDPVSVIKDAVSKELVPYYPLAGRLREKETRKLVVECNGEGVLFVEADARDLSLDDFREIGLITHLPCSDQLFYHDPGSSDILNSPLLLFQVTRLRCGGCILGIRINHTMLDAAGFMQFINAAAEIARGELLSIRPVWERHLLRARDPPRVTCSLPAYDHSAVHSSPITVMPNDHMIKQSFFFGPTEISALRRWLPPHLKSSSTFEIVSACLWQCRTIAIQLEPEELVRFTFTFNTRFKFQNLIPTGYYGNTIAFPMAITTANKLGRSPLGYAVELIQKAKAQVTEEYIRSVVDLMEIKDRPSINMDRNFMVTDSTRYGLYLEHSDFGWGPPIYVEPTLDGLTKEACEASTIYVPCVNGKGEKGLMCLMCLPSLAMERFCKEIHKMLDPASDTLDPVLFL